jgi:hypothetical protein
MNIVGRPRTGAGTLGTLADVNGAVQPGMKVRPGLTARLHLQAQEEADWAWAREIPDGGLNMIT